MGAHHEGPGTSEPIRTEVPEVPVIKSETKDGLLTVRQAPDGDRIRIALDGELDLSNAEAVEAPLLEALGSNRDVVIDLSKLEFIDSTGISLLVMAIRIKESGLSFIPCDSPEVRRVLNLTGLDERMRLYVGSAAKEELPPALPAA